MGRNSVARRQFIHFGAGAVAAGAAAKVTLLNPTHLSAFAGPVPPSDSVRFASIGTGVRGCELLSATLLVPGVQCVAVCDLYDARHAAAQEAVNNSDIPATRDYRAILAGAPKRPFDPVRFFRWRCFTDYGEGLGGDLFVHLISGIQFITSTNAVAQRAQFTGGLFPSY